MIQLACCSLDSGPSQADFILSEVLHAFHWQAPGARRYRSFKVVSTVENTFRTLHLSQTWTFSLFLGLAWNNVFNAQRPTASENVNNVEVSHQKFRDIILLLVSPSRKSNKHFWQSWPMIAALVYRGDREACNGRNQRLMTLWEELSSSRLGLWYQH